MLPAQWKLQCFQTLAGLYDVLELLQTHSYDLQQRLFQTAVYIELKMSKAASNIIWKFNCCQMNFSVVYLSFSTANIVFCGDRYGWWTSAKYGEWVFTEYVIYRCTLLSQICMYIVHVDTLVGFLDVTKMSFVWLRLSLSSARTSDQLCIVYYGICLSTRTKQERTSWHCFVATYCNMEIT